MDVDLRGDDDDDDDDDDHMEVGPIDYCIHWYHQSVGKEFASQDALMEACSKGAKFTDSYGGINMQVEVPLVMRGQ